MALIKFGMMMTDARGKLGGHVFTKTRNGATIRTKVTPTNPQTVAQQLARSIFGLVSAAWRTLSEGDRLAWNSAVSAYSRTNIFGDSYLPSGKNLFVQINSNLLNAGLNFISVPEIPADNPQFIVTSMVVDTAVETIDSVFSSAVPGVGFTKVLEATRPFSPGRYNFSGSYAKISSYSGVTPPTDLQLYTDYIAKYGSPNTGMKIGFRWYFINETTGQKSTPSTTTSIVV